MTRNTPNDYDPEDGWSDGIECCPHCGVVYSANGGYTGEVFNQSGTRYSTLHDAAPGGGPYFCSDCWETLKTNLKTTENRALTDY